VLSLMLGHYFSLFKSVYTVILPVVSEAPDISSFNLLLQSKVPASANHYKQVICLIFCFNYYFVNASVISYFVSFYYLFVLFSFPFDFEYIYFNFVFV